MKRSRFLLLVLCIIPSAYADTISTLELRHRPAEELIPVLEPLLGPDDSISGQGFMLLLRAPAATRRQIETAVRTLDVAPRTLLISVFQGSEHDLHALRLAAGLQSTPEHAEATIAIGRTRARRPHDLIHQLRVSEGAEGYIETGRAIPYFSALLVGPAGIAVGQEYRDVTTGFYVLARLHGARVSLRISPFRESLSQRRPAEIDTQRVHTTLSGPVGEWLSLGGVSHQSSGTTTGVGRYETRDRDDSRIWIKAEPAP